MSEDTLAPKTREHLTGLWQSEVAVEVTPGTAEQAQAIGRNFRLDLGKALAAVAATATAISTAARAAAWDPIAVFGLPAAAFAAILAGIAAVCEKMDKAQYVACVVLAEHPEGLTKADFEKNLRKFLDDAKGKSFPWYLGLTEERLNAAVDALGPSNDSRMGDLIKGLEHEKYIEEKDGRFHYAVPNFKLDLTQTLG
jgi:hypothetical protein